MKTNPKSEVIWLQQTEKSRPLKDFKNFFKAAIVAAGDRKLPVPEHLTVVFVDPADMRKINWQFRRRRYTADVLSFLNLPGEGEIVICPSVLEKNARVGDLAKDFLQDKASSLKWGFREECRLILIHGLLHLCGLDHSEVPSRREKMIRLQREIFLELFLYP